MQAKELQQLKDETAVFLKRMPTDREMERSLPRAERKLKRIIEREGDSDGMKQQPWYLGKLVEEAIIEAAFEQQTNIRCMEIEAQRQAAKADKIKKAAPKGNDHTTTKLYIPRAALVKTNINRRNKYEIIELDA